MDEFSVYKFRPHLETNEGLITGRYQGADSN
jgi:hypothetical protein